MTQVLETVTVDIDKNSDIEDCPFQSIASPKNKPNPAPGEDNDTYNDSGVLTDNLKAKVKLDADAYPNIALDASGFRSDGPDIGTNVGLFPNAHHLVPGHASLPYSDVCKFMGDKDNMPEKCKKPSKIEDGKGGIDYDVNSYLNGKWLPSNNALRGRWHGTIQAEYAFLAINRAKAQFHDAHTDYNRYIRDRLQEIYTKLNSHIEDCNLKPCKGKKKGDKFDRTPYPTLTNKLYGVSKRIAKYLNLSNLDFWHLPDVQTSRFCGVYYKIANGQIKTPTVVPCGGNKKPVRVTDYSIIAVTENKKDSAR